MQLSRPWILALTIVGACSDGPESSGPHADDLAGDAESASVEAGSAQDGALGDAARDSGSSHDAGATLADACGANPLPESKLCTRDDECVVAFRDGCCGGSYYGVHRQSASAAAQNRACNEPLACGPLGCASIDRADDGSSIYAASEVVAVCKQGVCATQATSATFSCGAQLCPLGTYCESFGGGTPDSGVSYACRPMPTGCAACACFSALAGCGCRSDASGNVYRDCRAP